MKRTLMVLLLTASVLAAGQKGPSGRWSGWVSDRKCGTSIDPDCNRRCLANGEAPVLVVDGSGDVLSIANPEVLRSHGGTHVMVTGTLDGKVLTIRSVKVPRCRRGDPSGYFEGSATSQEAGALKVALNLSCAKGRYQGELLTQAGNYAIGGGSTEAKRLHLDIVGGGAVGTIDLRVAPASLQGTFRLAGDTGPVELHRVAAAKPVDSGPSTMALTAAQWRQDLQFFARELPKRHANAFHYISGERFEKEVSALDAQLDHLNADQIYVGMDRIANLVGDAHTYIRFPADTANFPIDFGRFGGEERVIAAGPGLEKAVGARVVKVQDLPIEEVREKLRAITPQDENPQLGEANLQSYLTQGMVLHGFGITPERNTARYTLADDSGKEFTIEVHTVPPGTKIAWTLAYREPPLFRQKPEEKFWFVYLPDSRTVYCNERSVRDLKGPGKKLLQFVQEKKPDKLVIDLRQNGGGDFNEGLHYLIEPIRDLPGINRKGHLFVLVGARTFSAAMSNAAQFRSMTAALLVGGTIGERPNSYQEGRQMTLPNSHLGVNYSVKFYKFVESGENVIRPDHEILPTWADYKAGRDPVLEWVLNYHPER